VVRAFLAIAFILLLTASPASAATRTEILRDCQDGSLSGTYTPSELRDARSHIPADIDQYSDCRDVLTRALTSGSGTGTSSGGGGGGGGGSSSGGASSSGSSGGGTSSNAGSGGASTPSSGTSSDVAPNAAAPAPVLKPQTQTEQKALTDAGTTGGATPVTVGERPIVPGATAFDAGEPGNRLPNSLVITLVLLAVAAAAAAAPTARRRVLDRRTT
jgi:hypothetical protein